MNFASHIALIALINDAKAENVNWQVAGPDGVIIGSGAHTEGNILAKKAIIMTSGAYVHPSKSVIFFP
jgi:hypothetical protein